MKPLSFTRKAIVSIALLLGIGSLLFGFLADSSMFLQIGKYLLVGFIVLFVLLILPYWRSDPKLGPEITL